MSVLSMKGVFTLLPCHSSGEASAPCIFSPTSPELSVLVVVANSVSLFASAAAVLACHLSWVAYLLGLVSTVGWVFFLTQLGEGALSHTVIGPTDLSGPLLLMQIHASHIGLGLTLCVLILSWGVMDSLSQSFFELFVVYWHLIDVVWITIVLSVIYH